MCTLIWVVYDGMQNAVFDGQVLAQLRKAFERGKYHHVILVSFEKKMVSKELIKHVIGDDCRLQVVILKKYPFLGRWSLRVAACKLAKILTSFSSYELVARGALAGFIAQRAIQVQSCTKFTVQARGLLAEEYWHAHQHARGIMRLFYWWRTRLYFNVEQEVYGGINTQVMATIEVVSNALQRYLFEKFGTQMQWCTLACNDIPARISPAKVAQWRELTRLKLIIAPDQMVYCFCGSVQPWQCPEMVVDYFIKRYAADRRSFLLVLTPDVSVFSDLLQGQLPSEAYLVIRVCHEQVCRYLAAADVGIIFREAGVVSWVARPVKAMEYEAVGLRVVHNNTVAWLIKRTGRCSYEE